MRVINYVFYGAIVALATFTLGLFVLVRFGLIENPLPSDLSNFIPKAFIVESGSMEPAVKVGSLVITSKSPTYVSGDIITFKGPGKETVTHRIQYKDYPNGLQASPEYLTAGDANKTFDTGKVKEEQIVGKVVFTLPFAGYLASFAKDPKGFILLVIVPATIIIYEELKFIRNEFGKAFSRFWAKRKKKKIINVINFLPEKKDKPLPRTAIIVPVAGAICVMIALSAAYFFDLENSLGNILGVATSFGEKTANLYDSNEYTCQAGATNFSDPQAKIAILETEGRNIKTTVVLDGATPSSSYDIWINQDPGGCPLGAPTQVGAITTDINGDGTGVASALLVENATIFWISAVGGGQVLRSTAVSF